MVLKIGNDVHEPSVKYQYIAALVVNMLPLTYGVTCGWASPNLVLLMSENTPLPSGKIGMDEASWIASLICIGGLVGNLFFGYITSKFGRKIPLMCIAVPTIISWSLILFAQDVYYLYASRTLNGFVGGGLFSIVPSYLSEIAVDSVRGVLGSSLVLICNLGILLAFVFGNYCNFYFTPKFVIGVVVLCFVLLMFFPDSPASLVKRNKILEAEKSIRFYQSLSKSNRGFEILHSELEKLKSAVGTSEKSDENSIRWSDLMENPGKKAMTIGIVLAMLNQLCGCFAMLQYTASIFQEAGSNMSPNMSAIVIGVIQLLGSYVASLLVDRAGRKFLFTVSTVGIALGLIALGVYMILKNSGVDVELFTFVPIASFSFVIFIASWAVLSLPFLVISEVMPDKLKDFGSTFCMTMLWACSFLVIKFLPLLTGTFGFPGTMFIFAGICLSTAVFILLCMPETKGKSYNEIMKALQ